MFSSLKTYLKQSQNFYSLAGNMLYALLSMATFLLMVRILDREIYGRWVIYMAAISLLDMLRFGFAGTPAIRMISTSVGSARKLVIASSYQLGGAISLFLGLLFLLAYTLIHPFMSDGYYLPVLLFYPLLSIAGLPLNQASVVSQGLVNFRRILVIKLLQGGLNFLFLSGYILWTEASIQGMILMHIGATGICSLFAVIKKWDGLQHVKRFQIKTIRQLMRFGKFATAGSIGSNLLRSSDTFLMSMSQVMGAEAIAIYAIPFKLVELVEIPLRSFTAAAFPKLSQAFHVNRKKFNHQLGQYVVLTSLLLLPVIAGLLLFSDVLLQVLGGGAYQDSLPLQTSITYIVAAYIFVLPFDRYSGVGLLAVDKPRLNFIKIMLMLLANILFDVIAIFIFQSLLLVAAATLVFTLFGLVLGWYYLGRESGIRLKKIPAWTGGYMQSLFSTLKKQVHGSRIQIS